jgi:hypothetical protein
VEGIIDGCSRDAKEKRGFGVLDFKRRREACNIEDR